MRIPVWMVTLAYLPACAHTGAGSPDRSGRPAPAPSVAAVDTNALHVPENVQSVWAFEVWPASPEAAREVGAFGRQEFLARFSEMRREACARGAQLAVVTFAAGGVQVPEDVTFNGKLSRVRFFYRGRAWEGDEIPC